MPKTSKPAPPLGNGRSIPIGALCAGIFVLALLIRLLYLLQLSRNPDLLIPLFDAQGYTARADQWIRGHGINGEVFEFSLLYHLLLSGCFFVTDASFSFARGVQLLLGSLACALLASATTRAYGRRAGIAAGALAALYGPAIILGTELMPATVETLWCAALLAAVLTPRDAEFSTRRRIAFGLLGGFGFLLAPRFGFTWLIAALLKQPAQGGVSGANHSRRNYTTALAFAAPLFLSLILLNGRLTTSATFGRWASDFYLGNSGDLCRTLGMRPGPDYFSYHDAALREADRLGISVARYFAREATSELSAHPLRFAGGLGMKLLHLVSSREMPGAMDLREGRDATTIIRPLFWQYGRIGFPFALVFALAAAGLVFRRDEFSRTHLVLLIVSAAMLILTRVTAADRVPWVFLLLPLAGAGAAALTASRGPAVRPKLKAAGTAAVAALLIACMPGPFCVEAAPGHSERMRSIGNYFMQRYEVDRAASYFQEALSRDSSDAQAWNGAGICQQLKGRLTEARTSFLRAIELRPDYAFALFNLATVESALGRADQAASLLDRGLALQPRNGQAHNDLGLLLLREGRAEEAIPHFEKAREINPTVLDPRLNLALAYQALGRLKDALKESEDALKLAPLDPRVHAALGFIKLRLGDIGAEGHFLAARDLAPRSADAYYGLAATFLQAKRFNEAHQAYTNAVALDDGKGASRLTAEERQALGTTNAP